MTHFKELVQSLRTFSLMEIDESELQKLLIGAAEAIEALLTDRKILENYIKEVGEKDE